MRSLFIDIFINLINTNLILNSTGKGDVDLTKKGLLNISLFVVIMRNIKILKFKQLAIAIQTIKMLGKTFGLSI